MKTDEAERTSRQDRSILPAPLCGRRDFRIIRNGQVGKVTVDGWGYVVRADDMFRRSVGRPIMDVRRYCHKQGWTIEPAYY